jgi:hypothetical protein
VPMTTAITILGVCRGALSARATLSAPPEPCNLPLGSSLAPACARIFARSSWNVEIVSGGGSSSSLALLASAALLYLVGGLRVRVCVS